MSLGPRGATPGPLLTFSSAVGSPPTSTAPVTLTGPCGTTKTTNKAPGEEEEVPYKECKGFQTATLVVQPTIGGATALLEPKQKAMPTKRGDTRMGVSGPAQASSSSGSNTGPLVVAWRYRQWTTAATYTTAK